MEEFANIHVDSYDEEDGEPMTKKEMQMTSEFS